MTPKSALVALGVAAVVSVARGEAAEPPLPFGTEARVAHIAGTLAAVASASPGALKEGIDYARVLDRGACSAGAARLRVECLLVAIQRYCHDRPAETEARNCALYMDVVVSNVLADRRLVPPGRRYEIVRANVDYRPALAREIRRIEGTLAVDFRLQTGPADDAPTMARNIDRYCLAGEVRAPALPDRDALSYAACVSALVWFIKGPPEEASPHASATNEERHE